MAKKYNYLNEFVRGFIVSALAFILSVLIHSFIITGDIALDTIITYRFVNDSFSVNTFVLFLPIGIIGGLINTLLKG